MKKIQLAKVTKKQELEFAFLIVLVLIGLALWWKLWDLVLAGVIVGLIGFVLPIILRPFAVLWFTFAELLGIVSTGIFLSLTYFLIVTPIGVFRRILGYDSMKLGHFKENHTSVFVDRNHTFNPDDFKEMF